MGLRFRKSIKILPFVRVNLTKKGISSVSISGKGLTVNRSRRGTRVTTSLPGSGLSYSQQFPDQFTEQPRSPEQSPIRTFFDSPYLTWRVVQRVIIGLLIILFLRWIF